MPSKVDPELPVMVMPTEPTAIDGSWKNRKPSKVPEVGALRLAVSLPVRFIGAYGYPVAPAYVYPYANFGWGGRAYYGGSGRYVGHGFEGHSYARGHGRR